MDVKVKQQWSEEESECFLALWSSAEVQRMFEGASRTKHIFQKLQLDMAAAGYKRSLDQLVNKLKRVKKEYRDQKKELQLTGGRRLKRNPHFALLDSVLGHKPSKLTADRPPQSAAALLESLSDGSGTQVTGADPDDPLWHPDEVQVLITLWAQENIQKQLHTSATADEAFTFLSNELALVGFKKTALQCSQKVEKLKEDYKNFKKVAPNGRIHCDWFAILDDLIGANGDTPKEVKSSPPKSQKKDDSVQDTSQTVWTSGEVQMLLARWAEESVQEQLRSDPSSERVFALLSSALATQGFNKSSQQCRTKIRQLKLKYQTIQGRETPEKRRGRWFDLMDKVFGCHKPAAVPEPGVAVSSSLQALEFLPGPVPGCDLSLSSLCLLVPTLRLMCAFAWQVVQSCNVPHYVKVEELVRSVTELLPSLLTPTERVQLLLKLRARHVLELCRHESTANLHKVQPHLKVIEELEMSPGCGQEEQLENSKLNFEEVVYALLSDAEERRRFFKELFPLHFGPQFELALNTLVWKLISKLDRLLPVPDITQTAMWIGKNPSVLEECGQLVLDSDQLKELLLFHQQQLGNPDTCSSQSPSLFLPMVSLHLEENSKLSASERLDASAADDDDEQFDCSEDQDQAGSDMDVQGCCLGQQTESDSKEITENTSVEELPQPQKKCYLCPYTDHDVFGLIRHMKTHQEEEFPPAQYGCDMCDKKYVNKESLTVHRRIHTGEAPYLCSQCGKSFRSAAYFEVHTRIHSGERRYKCHICGKTSHQHMARHMRMHRGEKNYMCEECGKTFITAKELKLHLMYHSGVRPYKCRVCGKDFVLNCQLTLHMRKHSGVKLSKCPLCPKAFRFSKCKKKHMEMHANKSFPCLTCGQLFREPDNLKAHMESHKDTTESVETDNCTTENTKKCFV